MISALSPGTVINEKSSIILRSSISLHITHVSLDINSINDLGVYHLAFHIAIKSLIFQSLENFLLEKDFESE